MLVPDIYGIIILTISYCIGVWGIDIHASIAKKKWSSGPISSVFMSNVMSDMSKLMKYWGTLLV